MEDSGEALGLFSKIRNIVETRDIQLWSNEAFIKHVKQQIKELEYKIENLNWTTTKLDKENDKQKLEIENEVISIEGLKTSIKLGRASLLALKEQIDLLEADRKQWSEKYESALNKYASKCEDQKNSLAKENLNYNRLIQKQVEEKKLRINLMVLQEKINTNIFIRKQQAALRKQIFYADMIQFAKAVSEYIKNKELHAKIKIVESTELVLLEEYGRLQLTKSKREIEEHAALNASIDRKKPHFVSDMMHTEYRSLYDQLSTNNILSTLHAIDLNRAQQTSVKNKSRSTQSEVLKKKARFGNPNITVLDVKVIPKAPIRKHIAEVEKKAVSSENSEDIILQKQCEINTKPMVKQVSHKLIHDEKKEQISTLHPKTILKPSSNLPRDLKLQQKSNSANKPESTLSQSSSHHVLTNKNINALENIEQRILPKIKRTFQDIDTSIFPFVNNTYGKLESQKENLKKDDVINSSLNYMNESMVVRDSCVNEDIGLEHSNIQEQKGVDGITNDENINNLNLNDVEMIEEILSGSQHTYPGSQYTVFEMENNGDDTENNQQSAFFQTFDFGQINVNVKNGSPALFQPHAETKDYFDMF